VRVLTWNLWWRFGDWQRRGKAIDSVLAACPADIYGLQEVWATDTENDAHLLAHRHGLHHVWAPSPRPQLWQQRLGDHGAQIGNAILSRWPIVTSEVHHLPAGDSDAAADEGRTLLFAQIDSPVGVVSMFTTQLNSQPQDSAVRCAQVRTIAAVVARHRSPDFPTVLTGDFNADPHSDEIRLMEGHRTAPPVPGQVLLDAWRYAAPGDLGLTWNARDNPYVQATYEPSARIDYVFVGPPGAGGTGSVRSARLIGDDAIDGVWPSDHAGVLVELRS